MKKNFMQKLMAAAILTLTAVCPSWADDITSLQDLKNALGENIYNSGADILWASNQSDFFVDCNNGYGIPMGTSSFESLGNGIYEVKYTGNSNVDLLFTVENGKVVKIQEPAGAGYFPQGEYTILVLGVLARNGCEEYVHYVYVGDNYFHIFFGEDIDRINPGDCLFQKVNKLNCSKLEVGKVYHITTSLDPRTVPTAVLCDKATYTLRYPAPDKDYLCFTANTTNSTVELKKYDTPTAVTIQYSINGGTSWTSVDFSTATTTGTITLANVGDKVYFRNAADEVTGFSTITTCYYQFTMSGKIAASGNVMSLVDKSCTTTDIPCSNCFRNLFNGCESLTVAPVLPATTLADYCYNSMFNGCTSLTTAPALPAETLAENCYTQMFNGCTSLTTAPALPATTVEKNCYSSMFEGCTSLTTAPELPATSELVAKCYTRIFYNCGKINYIKVGFTEWTTTKVGATKSWLDGVASNGIFICPDELDTKTRGVSNVPEGWSVNGFDLTVSSAGWASMYLPIDVTIPEGAEVYYAASASGNVVTLKSLTGAIPAGTGVIVKAAEGTVFFPYTTTAVTPVEGNLLEGVASSTACNASENYVLNISTSTAEAPCFSNYTGTSLGAFKAYMPKSAVGGASSIQFRFADATAVSTVETEAAEDVIYNLAGQRVDSDYRGIVIKNGKKMWNK